MTPTPEDIASYARDPTSINWAFPMVRLLHDRKPSLVQAWSHAIFDHFLLHPACAGDLLGVAMYAELVIARKPMISKEDFLLQWPRHEAFPLQRAVLNLWFGEQVPDRVEEVAVAVQILFDELLLDVAAREAPIVLFTTAMSHSAAFARLL